MSRWTDLAVWRGPTGNQNTGHVECRGLVVHIASGFFEGTISWEKNPSADVSSHFVVGRAGQLAQLVDTNDTAWTQQLGNGRWLSVECEGFAPEDPLHASHPGWETLTAAQVEVVARLFEHGHREWGYPLQMATSPSGMGLGHHSMGAENGVQWGHAHCPGEAIKAQKPAILARALQIAGVTPTSTPPQGDTMITLVRLASGLVYRCEAGQSIPLPSEQALTDICWAAARGAVQLARGTTAEWQTYKTYGQVLYTGGWSETLFGPVPQADGPATPPAPTVDVDALAAKVVAGLAGQTGLTAGEVTDAVVAGLGRLHLTVAS